MTPALFHQHHNQPWPLLLFGAQPDTVWMSWREQVRRVDISLYHDIVECESSSSKNYRME